MAQTAARPPTERGSAVLEGVMSFTVLAAFTIGLLTGCYLLFARGFIEYESEQALYCLAEGQPSFICRSRLRDSVARYLPFGSMSRAGLGTDTRGLWDVDVEWQWSNYRVQMHRKLSSK